MGQSFRLKRSLLLFKLIFINNAKNPGFKQVQFMLPLTIVIFGVVCIFDDVNFINPISVSMSFFITTMLVLTLTLRGYEQYIDKLNVCTSYMLPASVNEKFFIPLLSSFILITGMLSVIYVIWSLLQLVVGGGDSFDAIITNILNDFSVISLFIGFLFAHSLCCLCSVLFKKSAPFPFIFVLLLIISNNVRRMSIDGSEHLPYLLSLPPSFWYCSMIILSLFFWFVAYCIFRGQQLNK